MCITHFAKFWAYKTTTRSLILKTFSRRNQKQTREGSREGSRLEAWRGPWCSTSLGGFVTESAVPWHSKTANVPLRSIEKHIPGLNENDLWIIDPIWLLIPPLPSAGLDNRDLYALRGVFTDESALELARGGGKDSGLSAGDEGRVLVPSWDPGKSLHSISSSTRWEQTSLILYLSCKGCESSENAKRARQYSNTE